MLSKKVNGHKWRQTMLKKLYSFNEKCPVLFGIETGLNGGKDGVFIVHEGSQNKYFFEYDTSIEEKDFIHNIKQTLIENHYPRLIETITESIELSPEEIVAKMEKDKNLSISELSKFELKEIGYKVYRIDKSIMWKGIFILVLEDIVIHGEEKKEIPSVSLRYKFNGVASLFMKKYRSGGFSSLEEASKYFFENAILIDELT